MQYRELRRLVASLTLSDFNNRISVFYIKLKGRAADHTNCILKESNIFSPHACCIICIGFATKSLRNMLRATFGRRSAVTVGGKKLATDKDLICINSVLKLTSNAPELNDVRRKTKNRNITFTDKLRQRQRLYRNLQPGTGVRRAVSDLLEITRRNLQIRKRCDDAGHNDRTNTILTNCYSSSCQLRITLN